MREVQYWESDDGKKFQSYEECHDYEVKKEYEKICPNCVFLDEDFLFMNPLKRKEFEQIEYIKLNDANAFSWFCNLCNDFYTPCDGLDGCGPYRFDYESSSWVNLNYEIERLKKALMALDKGLKSRSMKY